MIFLPDNQTNQQTTEQPQQQLQIPADIKTFLENLIKEAGLIELDEPTHEEMVKELYARLDNYIASTIIDNLPEDSIEEFIQMNEAQKPQHEIEQYLQTKIPDANKVMTKAFMGFRDLYLGNIAVARNAPGPVEPATPVTPPAASEATEVPVSSVPEDNDLNKNQTT